MVNIKNICLIKFSLFFYLFHFLYFYFFLPNKGLLNMKRKKKDNAISSKTLWPSTKKRETHIQ